MHQKLNFNKVHKITQLNMNQRLQPIFIQIIIIRKKLNQTLVDDIMLVLFVETIAIFHRKKIFLSNVNMMIFFFVQI